MKLNNKGFAISSIMYIILVLAVILISLILVTLSSRKLVLDKLKEEVLTTIYDAPNITYRQTIKELKNQVIDYMTTNSLEKESIKVNELNTSIDNDVLGKYKLNDKYVTAVKNTDSYDVYLGKASTITDTTQLPKNTIDIVDYKIYGNSIQGKLPSEYQQVEYIESDGNQYIDTGIYLTNEDEIVVEYMSTSTSNYVVFGARNSANSKNIGAGLIDDYFYADFNNSNYNTYRMGYAGAITNQKLKYVLSKEGRYLYSGETLISGNTTLCNDEFTTDQTSYLFYGNGTQTSKARILIGRIYSFKVYRNNNLIMNMIPCYRILNNEIGMYDLVENKFYQNIGTGTFSKGSNAPTPEVPIEVESVGDLITDITDNNYGKYQIAVKTSGKNLLNVPEDFNFTRYYRVNSNIPSGKYKVMYETFSSEKDGVDAGHLYLRFDGANKGVYLKHNTNQVTITLETDANLIHFYGHGYDYVGSANYNVNIKKLMLIPDSEIETEYEPYVEPVTTNIYLNEPLRKIGEYDDYIGFGDTKIHRKNKEIDIHYILKDYEGEGGIISFYGEKQGADVELIPTALDRWVNPLCNYSNKVRWSNNTKQVLYAGYSDFGVANLDELRALFTSYVSNGKPLTCTYTLETPSDITTELPKVNTSVGATKITIDTNISPSKYEFTIVEKIIEI